MAPNHFDLNGDVPVDDNELSNGCKSNDQNKEIHIEPRIGDEYQVELPDIMTKSIYMFHSNTEANIQKISIGSRVQLTGVSSSPNNDGLENFGPFDLKINGEIEHEEEPRDSRGKGRVLVPGLDEHWSDIEKGSFLLGLYVFLKDFVVLRRFIETKGMGAVMSFYYERFYRRAEHKRWLECKKTKSRKCVFGKRVFSGLRQQELLSRIFPKVSEELRNALLEVSKTFSEEKMSLVDYVFSLKAMIGINILVEAVAIGMGKQDLTGMGFESSRPNQAIPSSRPEIPTGSACSSLTRPEIIRFLRGDYRLSKARSNDLFWEAVWPRLLARGWHSEQPSNKSCLVFLGPDVKKFSIRKLVKGEHYFDSIAEVLRKVGNEPSLIELESDEKDDGKREEGALLARGEGNENDNARKQNVHLYLQPKTPKRNRPVLQFMVVDTSLSGGKKRELRSFPSGIPSVFIPDDRDVTVLDPTVVDDSKSRGKMPVNGGDKRFGKSLVRREVERGDDDGLGPITKCQRRSDETGPSPKAGPVSENGSSSFSSGYFEFHENLNSRVVEEPSSSTGSSSRRKPLLIDLNVPQVDPDFEYEEQVNGPGPRPNDNGPVNEARPKEVPVVNPRRQSTRTRDLSARALEALASGYLDVNRRRRARDPHEDVGPSSRPSQRARGRVGPNEAEAGPCNTRAHDTLAHNEASPQMKEESPSQ